MENLERRLDKVIAELMEMVKENPDDKIVNIIQELVGIRNLELGQIKLLLQLNKITY